MIEDIISALGSVVSRFTVEPLYFKGFSANVLPGTVGAPGFDLKSDADNFYTIQWGLMAKISNSSKENFTIENIASKWKGKNDFICKSDDFLTTTYKGEGENDRDTFNKLMFEEKKETFFPFIVKAESEIFIQVNFVMDIYKNKFPNRLERVFFRRTEIKEPETYRELYQKSFLKIKLNGKWRSMIIKPREFLVAGDILNIPGRPKE